MNQYVWNIFISHASEDKVAVARPLANRLSEAGLKVWLDEAELTLGDSLRTKIDEGLAKSQFGVVVLSPSFFAKNWPRAELDALIATGMDGKKRVLPVWHGITADDLNVLSPLLAGLVAVSTVRGLDHVCTKILEAVEVRGRAKRIEEPIYAGNITKEILMSLPVGGVLMTNTVKPDLTPTLSEELGPPDSRLALWERLKKENANGRRCYVFANWAGYRAHLAARSIWN